MVQRGAATSASRLRENSRHHRSLVPRWVQRVLHGSLFSWRINGWSPREAQRIKASFYLGCPRRALEVIFTKQFFKGFLREPHFHDIFRKSSQQPRSLHARWVNVSPQVKHHGWVGKAVPGLLTDRTACGPQAPEGSDLAPGHGGLGVGVAFTEWPVQYLIEWPGASHLLSLQQVSLPEPRFPHLLNAGVELVIFNNSVLLIFVSSP